MGISWKGGYPVVEQAEQKNYSLKKVLTQNMKTLIDTRTYYQNLPTWTESSKLLVTPTLDMDQELIFMPQYSRILNINMDMGLNQITFYSV